MGAMSGGFVATEDYGILKREIQKVTKKLLKLRGFYFRRVVKNRELNLVGRIALIDSEKFGEMHLDAAGIIESELKIING